MYKFEYILDENDYLEFNRYFFKSSPSQRRNMIWMRFGVAAIPLLLIPLVPRFLEDDIIRWVAYAALVLICLAWIFLFNNVLTQLLKSVMRTQNKGGTLAFGKNTKVSFNNDQIIETTELGENRTKYNNIEKIGNTSHAVYVFTNTAQAIIVPQRAFSSDVQKKEFMVFVENKRQSN